MSSRRMPLRLRMLQTMKKHDMKNIDKLYHFLVCTATSFASTELAIGLALGKEYGDKGATGNHWCWWDLLADAIGIVVGTGLRFAITGKYTWY